MGSVLSLVSDNTGNTQGAVLYATCSKVIQNDVVWNWQRSRVVFTSGITRLRLAGVVIKNDIFQVRGELWGC